jgi:TonB family protein
MLAFIRAALAVAGVAVALRGSGAALEACDKQGGEAAGTGGPRTAIVRVEPNGREAHKASFKPFSIKFPDQVDPKSFTNRATLDIEILPDGTVSGVKMVKSTGVPEVDEQVQEGVKKWRFGKSKEKLFLYLTVLIEIR